jgi:hypothetical protein
MSGKSESAVPLGRLQTPEGQTRDGTSRTAEVPLRSRTGAGCPAVNPQRQIPKSLIPKGGRHEPEHPTDRPRSGSSRGRRADEPAHETGGGEVGSATMVLVDLLTDEGVTGSSYVFCPTPVVLGPVAKLLSNLAPLIEGDPLAPWPSRQATKDFRLLGPQGLTAMATAGIDMAAWDALAKACELPLARLLGGEPRGSPPTTAAGWVLSAPSARPRKHWSWPRRGSGRSR